ncbi:C40 family peptidase [Tsukamurella ocularis]|uniref:C40 family peptidase n=1 Tax=Tsukamurella ocularis TaxID=1970234 RepID=UPI002167B017|nr:C40 family peptidase [Tsukamurella ocularis]MCS3782266.1 cell wall-associated NlpC family hydrolase [Tsukamurella ocularis]MCS3789574.1 cell wall-associated NlpC family hydrolase [Tsukamurella ocularis]MCS3852721.1 cell wall-associated NlpC family hydrolase [Tsukamurella ocularis]
MAKHRLQPQPSRGATVARGALAAGAVTIGTLAVPTAAFATPAPAAPAPVAPNAKPAPAPGVKPAVAAGKAKPAQSVASRNTAARPNVVTGVAIAPKPGVTTVAGVQPGGAKAKVVQAALSRTGLPYSYGSAGPNSFDCSGLVYWSMKQAGITVPRDSYGQLGGGRAIPISDLQAGDIVIYNGGSHAALYIGNGKVVHSVNYGIPVKVSPLNEMSVYSARRY